MRALLIVLLLVSPVLAETFAWDPPTSYTDGTPIDPTVDLKEYHLYDNNTGKIKFYIPGSRSSYTIANLPVGSYSFSLTAVDKKFGAESAHSNNLDFTKSAPNQVMNLRLGQ